MDRAPDGAVLIIDDEEGIRSVLHAILESIGMETMEAEDGKTALALLQQHQGRIVACLLDMNLEDSYGEDLYDKMRAISPNLVVFAMSGIFGPEIEERLGDREIAGLISKPFSTVKLIETVTNGLKGRRQ